MGLTEAKPLKTMDNEDEMIDSSNDQDVDTSLEETTEGDSDTETEDDAEVLKQQLKDAKQREAQMFERLQKAKGFVRDSNGKWVKPEKKVEPDKQTSHSDNLSVRDILALKDVPEEDLDEVLDFAKYKNLTVTEAKKHPVIQGILKNRSEERATAAAMNVGNQKRNNRANTAENLISRVQRMEDLSDEERRAAAKAVIESMKKR